jgi:hypothetical protein
MVKPERNRDKQNKKEADSLDQIPENRRELVRRILNSQEETNYLAKLQRRIADRNASPYINSSQKQVKQNKIIDNDFGKEADAGKDTVASELVGSLHDFQLEPRVPPRRPDTEKEQPPVKEERDQEPAPPPAPSALPEKHYTPPSDVTLQPGAIVKLEDGTVGIFEKEIPNKEYDILLMIKPQGTLEPEGVSLYAYEWQQIGKIPEELLEEMIRRKHWERDALVYYLDRYEYAKLIPNQKGPVEKPRHVARPPQPSRGTPQLERTAEPTLQRGRVISIESGDRKWNAVYWGSNNMGAILAHTTHKTWSLMHLDLNRFRGSLKYGELLDPEEIRKIEEELTKKYGLG